MKSEQDIKTILANKIIAKEKLKHEYDNGNIWAQDYNSKHHMFQKEIELLTQILSDD